MLFHPGQRRLSTTRLFWLLCVFFGLWLGFPNDFGDFPPLVFLWPIGLVALGAEALSPRQAFLRGWLASCCGFMAALYWLCLPVHYVGELPWLLAAFCAIFICLCLSTQGGFFSLLAFYTGKLNAWLLAPVLALSWYLLEWLYAVIMGVPWLPLAGALAAWPVLVQGADILGAYLLGAAWLGAALLCFLPFFRIQEFPGRKFSRVRLACGLSLIASLLCYGFWRLETNPPEPGPDGPNTEGVLFVEGNVDQNQKWVPKFQRETLTLYIGLTEKGLYEAEKAGIKKPLIIWPETALPFFVEKRPDLMRHVRKLAKESGCPILFGAPGSPLEPGLPADAVFNRAFIISPSGEDLGHYDKEHLVPFGEYLPAWLHVGFLESLLQGVGIYVEGTDIAPIRYGPLALGILICYEGIFPWLAQERVAQGANILVDISNDGWFGKSPAARQHLYLTLLRCVEQNRWLLRGTNTGISAIADSRGRVTARGPMFQAGALAGRARLLAETTPYHQIANILPALILAILCIILLVCYMLKKRYTGAK